MKEIKKQSGFNKNRDSYVTDGGDIVYLTWEQIDGQWKHQEVARVEYADMEASGQTEVVSVIDESHRSMDLQEDRDKRHIDKKFSMWQAGETGDDTDFREDPLEQIPDPNGDVFNQLFPKTNKLDQLKEKIVDQVIESLSEKDQDLFWAYFGERKTLAEIRRDDIKKNGFAPTPQAYSKRLAKIKDKVRKAVIAAGLFKEP